jgi:hypothetical protein
MHIRRHSTARHQDVNLRVRRQPSVSASSLPEEVVVARRPVVVQTVRCLRTKYPTTPPKLQPVTSPSRDPIDGLTLRDSPHHPGRFLMDPDVECARELVLAIFRLAVADCMGVAYGHDGPGRPRRVARDYSSDASRFLDSSWAEHLADISGFSADAVRQQLQWPTACRVSASGVGYICSYARKQAVGAG